ncbi:uncharacterized protein L203_102867 [Cryptococcus depauperatus CBS 7841]|uniref:Uncharacterized protein n=1 Tax=Cryptococcus depauperatus CBS 7841 TaxID=1295531 RepID=A0AAJ8JSL6_9TREE
MSKQQSKPTLPKPYSRPQKAIHKTVDLLQKNESCGVRGKGKEKDILGDVMSLVDDVKRLPGMISVEKFAQTRAMEIYAFQTAIKAAEAQGNTRAFQSLPRHLRRRAASHNPRRVPRRLRSRAAAEIDTGDTIAKKHRKIAKQRAKGNLRSHLKRATLFRLRQRSKSWLPTHLWHAKRYHMENLWGWRLPITPTLKCFRHAYRAGRRKAVAWDVSYYGIVEVEGKRQDIINLLTPITGGKFAGQRFENGTTVARVSFYQHSTFPRGLVGPAEILWQPQPSTSQFKPCSKIWIRLHPSIFTQVWESLKISSLQATNVTNSTTKTGANLQIKNRSEELEALEITGPRSGEVLRRVFKLCKREKAQKGMFFNNLGDPVRISDGAVIGLSVYDPRLNFPPRRLAIEDFDAEDGDGTFHSRIVKSSIELAYSSLWDEKAREQASQVRYTKYQLDARRHRLGLPGTRLHPASSDNRLPMILIHHSTHPPPTPNSHSFYGFTILLPSSWAQYVLNSIAYCSTFVGGLKERQVQHREAGVPSFPECYGNVCKAGADWEKRVRSDENETWNKKPPAKRVGFDKIGISCPWLPNWSLTMKQEKFSKEEESFVVQSAPRPYLVPYPFSAHLDPDLTPPQYLTALNAFRAQRCLQPLPSAQADDLYREAVLHVEVQMLRRGSPGDMAVICSLDKQERHEWIDAYENEIDDLGSVEEMSVLQKLGESRPSEQHLIGWTTTGNISLTRGRGYALGVITLSGYLDLLRVKVEENRAQWKHKALVCIRNRNGRVSRLAELKVVC